MKTNIFTKAANAYENSEKTRKMIFFLILAGMFALMFILTRDYPLLADDNEFAYIFWTQEPISKVSDLFVSFARFYINWSGRVSGIMLVQLCHLLGRGFYFVANSCAYCVFIFLVYLLCGRHKRYDCGLLILINLAVWAFNPSFEESMLWMTGSCNYMWCLCVGMVAYIPFKRYLCGEKISSKWTSCVLFGIASLINGNTVENLASGFIVFGAAVLIVAYIREKKLPAVLLTGFIANIVGLAVDLLSPGTANRVAVTAEHAAPSQFGFVYTYVSRMNNITICFIKYMLPLIIVTALLFICFNHFEKDKKPMLSAAAFALFSITCAYSMILSPSFPLRTWLPSLMTLVIAAGTLLSSMKENRALINRLIFAALLLSAIPFALSWRDMLLYINSDFVGLSITGKSLITDIGTKLSSAYAAVLLKL